VVLYGFGLPQNGNNYANIAELFKMPNHWAFNQLALTKNIINSNYYTEDSPENKKGEGCFPFTFLRREISPATLSAAFAAATFWYRIKLNQKQSEYKKSIQNLCTLFF